MKKIIFSIMMIATMGMASAQTMTDASDIDPAAKKILDRKARSSSKERCLW